VIEGDAARRGVEVRGRRLQQVSLGLEIQGRYVTSATQRKVTELLRVHMSTYVLRTCSEKYKER
jgi:hypothetical protein